MASETGIENTIANYFVVITRCGEFGTNYDPVREEIKIVNMTTQYNGAVSVQNNYIASLEITKVAINSREVLFEQMREIAVRSFYVFKSSKAGKNAKKDARGYLNKITGKSKKIKLLDNGLPDPKNVSQSQQGYDNKVKNFFSMVTLFEKDGNYATNETVLKLATMYTQITELENANKNVVLKNADTIEKRQIRNYALFEEEKGVIDISLFCKNYVKGLYGPSSTEAKSICSVPLRRYMRIKKAL
ncbi:MAG: hypothetical protein WCL06_10270 [Bacteroidota bacterium]